MESLLPPIGDTYRFRAFLSYSTQNRYEGRVFQSFLEKYKLPEPLRSRVGAKRIGRVFRDRSDLAANSNLSASIEIALRQSQFLVVLCSPESAGSRWVNQEILYFRDLGRTDSIIPVLVAGKPMKFNPNDCEKGAFPPALFEGFEVNEPLAPNLLDVSEGGDGFEQAALKVIARMIDVPLDELTERHLEMMRVERRRDRNRLLVVSGLALTATFAAYLAWQQTQTSNKLLAEVLEAISEEVALASGMQDRYGVPSSVSHEFYDTASEKLSNLEDLGSIVGQHPKLRLERTRFELSMADFSNVLDLQGNRRMHVDAAAASFAELSSFENSVWKYLFPYRPRQDTILQTGQRLNSVLAFSYSDQGELKRALAELEDAITTASRQLEGADQLNWIRHLARNYCDLGTLQYAASDYPAAKSAYGQCHEHALKLVSANASAKDVELVVISLTQIGMINRAQNDPDSSLVSHRAALKQSIALSDQFPSSSSLKRLLALTYGVLGDSLRGAGQPPIDAVTAYSEGLQVVSALLASDPVRRDWQRTKMLLLERLIEGLLLTLSDDASSEQSAELFVQIDQALAELETMSNGVLVVNPDDSTQQKIHSTFLERRIEAAMLRSQILGSLGGYDPKMDMLKSIELRKRVAESKSATLQDRYLVVLSHITAGRVMQHFSQDAGSIVSQYDKAQSLLKALIQDEKVAESEKRNIDNWRYEVALIHFLKAQVYHSHGQYQSGMRNVSKSRAIIQDLLERFPDVSRYGAANADLNALEKSILQEAGLSKQKE